MACKAATFARWRLKEKVCRPLVETKFGNQFTANGSALPDFAVGGKPKYQLGSIPSMLEHLGLMFLFEGLSGTSHKGLI
jgi:hypothetical protein